MRRAGYCVPFLLAYTACSRGPNGAAPASKPPSEASLGRVTLTSEAEARLAIPGGLGKVERRSLPSRRLFPGEAMVVPGRAALLLAPLAGTVAAVDGASLPPPGTQVRAGQPLVALAPVLGPGERVQVSTAQVDAEAQVARAQVQDEAAELALQRAERLIADQVAGTRVLEEAQAQRETARATLKAARSQRSSLAGRGGLLAPVRLEAPLSGIVREVRVALRQQVAAGTPLLEVVSDDPLWVRVPVPSSEIAAVAAAAPALVGDLGAPAEAAAQLAPPVLPTPPTAQPQLGTVDLYFQLSGAGRPRLGQRVAAWVEEKGQEEGPVVPAAALLYDSSGGTWVYERSAPQTFLRRRVEVRRVEGPAALLAPGSLQPGGLALGAKVVTAGAMELLGAELGAGK